MGIGTSSPPCKLNVIQSGGGVVTTDCVLSVENSGSSNSGCAIDVLAGSSGTAGIVFGTRSNLDVGHWVADGATGECTFATDTLKIDCGQKVKRTAVSGTYTVLTTDYYLGITASSAVTLNLPAASTAGTGREYLLVVESGGSAVNVTPNGSDNLNGVNSAINIAGANGIHRLVCNGSAWFLEL